MYTDSKKVYYGPLSLDEAIKDNTLLCVYQQNPILATGDSSVISNYR